ncbi:hypothetical protein N182_37770 [Sinorhizobium sp. GL2]|nr:hypothetical protein N182_37770 [Sinorhizobium sp. GL2]
MRIEARNEERFRSLNLMLIAVLDLLTPERSRCLMRALGSLAPSAVDAQLVMARVPRFRNAPPTIFGKGQT